MEDLERLLQEREDWLMERVLQYAHERGYAKYTSTLVEAWRLSIRGISEALVDAVRASGGELELGPDDDYSEDPATAFGILEARRHRDRGIAPPMFLGLLKYYRQSYLDLLERCAPEAEAAPRYATVVNRFYDRLELGLCHEWSTDCGQDRLDADRADRRELVNEKNKYLTLFESLQTPVLLVNEDQNVVGANRVAARTFPALEAWADRYATAPAAPLRLPFLAEEVEAVTRAGARAVEVEHQLHTRSGERWFQARISPMLDVSQKFEGAVIVLHDVSASKDNEARLRRSRAELSEQVARRTEALTETAERLAEAQRIGCMGNWDWDIVTSGLEWSDEIYRIFGLQPQEFGASYPAFIERVHPEDREKVERAVERAVRGEIDYSIDHRILLPDGGIRTVHEQGEVYRNDQGQPVRMLGTVIDITQRQQLEEQLRQSQKMEAVGRLAGGIAHDFNNMLQAILMHASFAADENATEDQRLEDLGEIHKAAEKASTLTRQLLVFSRRQVLQLQQIDFDDLIEGMLTMLCRVLGEDIDLVYEPSVELGTVRADRGQLEQVILNLCLNARDAMPGGGELTIDVRNCFLDDAYRRSHPWVARGPMSRLSISDTGCGMSESVQSQIFEPFFTTKGPDQGTGLGLAIAWGVIKQHEGLIHAYSELGQGTTFRVYLPLDESPDEYWSGSGEQSVFTGGSETILVAEDDPAIGKALQRGLARVGYDVILTEDGHEALELFEQHRGKIALALLDVVMPGAGGREVYERIRVLDPNLPVLFSSGYSSTSIHKQQILERRMELIEKPYEMRELLHRIREMLDSVN